MPVILSIPAAAMRAANDDYTAYTCYNMCFHSQRRVDLSSLRKLLDDQMMH